jgi:carbonic anhydrase
MTVTDELLQRNEQYAASFDKGGLPMPPAAKAAVLACMDARLNVYGALGLSEGDAHVIRNAGGVVTDDAIRSLLISQELLGTEEIILIHHTDCGMLTFSDDEVKTRIQQKVGLRPPFALEAFPDLEDDVRQSIARIKGSARSPSAQGAGSATCMARIPTPTPPVALHPTLWIHHTLGVRPQGGPPGDDGQAPDYRFSLANERTFLAWIRTALALDAGGLVIIQVLPPFAVPGARELLGVALVGLGATIAVTSYRRWNDYEHAMRDQRPLPASRLPIVLSLSIGVISIVAVVLLVVGGGGS